MKRGKGSNLSHYLIIALLVVVIILQFYSGPQFAQFKDVKNI